MTGPPTRRGVIRRPALGRPARMTGVGAYRPAHTETSDDLGRRLGLEPGWIRSRTGIERRGRAQEHETLMWMATEASRKALAQAGLDPAELDCVVFSSFTDTRQVPGLAPAVGRELGALSAGAIDLNATCAGSTYGLLMAAGQIALGNADHVLVVASERLSDIVDPNDRNTAAVFADGAGAMIVSAGDAPGFGRVAWGSDGTAEDLLILQPRWSRTPGHDPATRPGLRMDGPGLARWFGSHMAPIAGQALEKAGTTWDDIDAFIPHQGNLRLTRRILAELRPPPHVAVAEAIITDGNTGSASIPLAIEHLLSTGRAPSGGLALLLGYGVGITWAAQVVRLP
ncbi:3-oxoacyl-ACP synthase III family protein [Streptomyces sp. NPDC057137]|uniref:3-oxoacyl-ACP synthase III family protein n=1 Tax=Streptomyces sp. NPDC057137 TaxID=3346030 RepID=UPI00363F0B45